MQDGLPGIRSPDSLLRGGPQRRHFLTKRSLLSTRKGAHLPTKGSEESVSVQNKTATFTLQSPAATVKVSWLVGVCTLPYRRSERDPP